MATIKEVALASGVSVATVSYILNGREVHLRPDTRERVLRTVRELNYRPNARFRGQNTRLKKTIGFIFPNFGGNRLLEQPYYLYILDGMLYTLAMQGWNTTLFAEQDWESSVNSLRTFCDGRCDGLILAGPDDKNQLLVALQERGFPFVLVNSGSNQAEYNSVDVDNVAAAREVIHFLASQGHQKIALIMGSVTHASTEQRNVGADQGFAELGLSCPDSMRLTGEYTELSGYQRAKELLNSTRGDRPTALFCGNDLIARGAYQAIHELGLSIPKDISVIGFDDLEFAARLDPPLTTTRQPLQLLGERAVEIVLEQVNAGAAHNRTIRKDVLPTELIIRQSVAPPGLSEPR